MGAYATDIIRVYWSVRTMSYQSAMSTKNKENTHCIKQKRGAEVVVVGRVVGNQLLHAS